MSLNKGRLGALFPFFVFLILYLCTSLWFNDFYKMPVIVAFLLSCVVGFVQYPKISFAQKIDTFCKQMGDSNIMLMCFIFLLAGAFSALSKSIGAVDSTVHFALTYISPSLLIAGLFIIACFISLSLGTSVGTVVALSPIAVGLSDSIPSDDVLPIALSAVIGGAMFGDNLSMISDTTIAATRTQGVEMRDKFRVNFRIAFPAAIITFLIYTFLSPSMNTPVMNLSQEYSIIKIIPYLFVLIMALSGVNVIWVLLSGLGLTGIIGIATGSIGGWQIISVTNSGLASMFELSITCMLISGMVGLIHFQGGIDFILYHTARAIKTKRGGEFGIAGLTALVNTTIANNTITILIVGPLAKTIVDKRGLDGRRSASILDTISCTIQPFLPYGAQMLAAVSLAHQKVSALQIIANLYYPFFLGIFTFIFILIRKNK